MNSSASSGVLNPPHIPLTVDENAIQKGALKILEIIRPSWKQDSIQFKLLTDGITNKLVGCKPGGVEDEDTVLVRVYGNKTDLLIDRKAETRNILFLNKVNLAPDLYATFENGLAYRFIPGRTINSETVTDPKIYGLVAKRMANLHKVGNDIDKNSREPVIWKLIQKFLDILPDSFSNKKHQDRFSKIGFTKDIIQREVQYMREKLEYCSNPIVFAHNDLLLGNVIYTEKTNSVTFIDYEYAGYNYQAYDIGNHFTEFVGLDITDYARYPSKEFQLDWLIIYLKEYLGAQPTEKELETLFVLVNQFALLSHLTWAIWALIQAEHSYIDFDFLGFSSKRLEEYFAKKDQFCSLKLPD